MLEGLLRGFKQEVEKKVQRTDECLKHLSESQQSLHKWALQADKGLKENNEIVELMNKRMDQALKSVEEAKALALAAQADAKACRPVFAIAAESARQEGSSAPSQGSFRQGRG